MQEAIHSAATGAIILRDMSPEEIARREAEAYAAEHPGPEALLAYLADKRWRVETGGCPFGGFVIDTSDRSQLKIAAAWSKAKADPEFAIAAWKVAPGVFVPLDNATILALGDAVVAHVQACFALERELALAITADPPQITTRAEIDAADWPANGK